MQSEPRPVRGWALVLPVLITVLVGAGLGGFVVLENQRQADRIGAADDVGADYLSEVATFRLRVLQALEDADEADPADLRRALQEALTDPPRLPELDAEARERSSTYAEAMRVEKTLMEPYEALGAALRRAEAAQRFVAAARKVLDLRASDYVDGVLLDDSSQVRNRLIPTYVSARAEFSAVGVPKGAEEAARLTLATVQEVIDKATRLADSIDANRSYTFSYGDSIRTAAKAVDDFATQAEGDLVEAINAVKDLT